MVLAEKVLENCPDFVPDASGKVVGAYQGDYMYANAAYDGFGNVLDSWNMSTFTNFTWGGGYGYRQTGLAYSSVYVRARHYSNMDAAWTTIDPLWPYEMPYGYVNGRVPGGVDYWGMQQQGKPANKGINTKGQHGNPRKTKPWMSRPSQRGWTNYVPIIDDILDYGGFFNDCILSAAGNVVKFDSNVGVLVRGIKDIPGGEVASICEDCCTAALTLAGDKVLEEPGAWFGAGLGTIFGLPFGVAPGTAIIGGAVGLVAGGQMGSVLGEELANNICPKICEHLTSPCKNNPGGPWTSPLQPVIDIWPSRKDWIDWLSPRLAMDPR
jgi:hypothetical protein